jgi:dolichol-phosphate mannosyltransferase
VRVSPATALPEENPIPTPTAAPAPKALSIIIPCYNEERTLAACVAKVYAIAGEDLALEVIIVNDCSKDGSLAIARGLAGAFPRLSVLSHERNRGKGAALRTGIAHATGDYVAIQDADLEYTPMDLRRLLGPLIRGEADVVIGSRFLSSESRRVLYFWHSLGNRFLTLLSNMLTDLNLTDMETCYKVFRREVIQSLELRENRFGFEPEVVAKIAQLRLRIYEMGIAYNGRTYAEGKKIGWRDGCRALYCVLKYNLHKAPSAIQFLFYLGVGGASAALNLAAFLGMMALGAPFAVATPIAFLASAACNYWLSVTLVFRHRARWLASVEVSLFLLIISFMGAFDFFVTRAWLEAGASPWLAKSIAIGLGLILNFLGRRYIVFPESANRDWNPQG